ncbi:MAG TPA: 50S ribosomal protein L16 [Candidatus Paceibacterota bacterium]|nr:50S ribosomal protein L16 [Candidatus Paceibacterota bacterium]
MLFPKKVKHRKWQTARRNEKRAWTETRGTTLSFGSYGLKATASARVRSNQLEASRKVIARSIGKVGKMWTRVFPDFPYTGKPAEVGMGKGKGDLQGYQVEVKPGRILFEVDGLSLKEAQDALRKAGAKLPVKTKVVSRANA